MRTNQEYIWCANPDLLGLKVRSPGQVKFRCDPGDRHQTSRSCFGHNFSPNDFKLSRWNFGVDTYRMLISDFSFIWPQVRSIFDPAHYNLRPIIFEPTVIDEWTWNQSVCQWYPIWPALTWPDLWLQIGREVKFWNWHFWQNVVS